MLRRRLFLFAVAGVLAGLGAGSRTTASAAARPAPGPLTGGSAERGGECLGAAVFRSREADPPGGSPAPAGAPAAYATHGDSRLAALLEQALARNPRIRAALSLRRAAGRRAPQVSARPDPMIMLTGHARPPETRVGPQTTLLSVTQQFPGFGKREARGQVAVKQAAERDERIRAERAEVVRQVKRAYYDLAYLDRALAISAEDEDLLRHYEVLARARYAQGYGGQGDSIRLQAEITKALNRRETLLLRRVDAEAALNSLLDRSAATEVAPVELGGRPAPVVDVAALSETGCRARPEVRAAMRQVESREQAIEVARLAYRPDFSVGVAWGWLRGRGDPAGRAAPPPDNGKDTYSLMVGMSVPLARDRYDAGLEEAADHNEAARAAYRGAVRDTERAVRATAYRIEGIERQIALFENALAPQAEQALSAAEAAYTTGGAGVLDLMDGQRVLLEVRLGLARLDADHRKALADLERVVGTAIPEGPPGGDSAASGA